MQVKHEKLALLISGAEVLASAPVIVSASRRTDIPAHFFPEFLSNLKRGFCQITNPFNGKEQFICFNKTRFIVFWTKNPEPAIKFLHEIDALGISYYFQFTLNDYESELFEQGIPNLEKRLEIFKILSNTIGKEKVIWRFDPLILHNRLDVSGLLSRIEHIGNELIPYTDKLVFSFVDIKFYAKVLKRISKHLFFEARRFTDFEFTFNQKLEVAEGLSILMKAWKKTNPDFEICSCAEDINLSQFGISQNHCIDDRLIAELFSGDPKMMKFLNPLPEMGKPGGNYSSLKDRGQRKLCGCILSKDIGSYNTCVIRCLYCYATR